jgi:hypothetical protein
VSIDTSVPHPARRYNYWLGGNVHFPVDRASGDAIAAAFPVVVELARANRAFQRRAVRHLAQAGVGQFLDIGTGLPAPDNTHEVARRVTPAARVVYVDKDPIVARHASALLTGGTAYFEADLLETAEILERAAGTLDLREPVGLLLVAVLHFVHDDARVAEAVERLVAALAPGSHVALSHGTMDLSTPAGVAAYEKMFAAGGTDVRARGRAEISGWLARLEIVEPGLTTVSDWRPEDAPADRPVSGDLAIYGVVARKP